MQNLWHKIAQKTVLDFKSVFGAPLHQFFHPITGFDVVKFDAYLKVPNGISIHQHVEKVYGPKASAICTFLLGVRHA